MVIDGDLKERFQVYLHVHVHLILTQREHFIILSSFEGAVLTLSFLLTFNSINFLMSYLYLNQIQIIESLV